MSYKVVILKTKSQSLKQAEQFLRNRQWQIIATTNLRDAIAAVIQKQPEFIMIAADHPNRKVRVLPKLIGQAFPVKVVGFVEASTNASMAILHEMGLEYNVFPPVSGPAIERTILKIKKDEEKRELDRQRAIENGTYMPETDPGATTAVTGDGFSNAREMLARLASGDENQDDSGVVPGSPNSPAGLAADTNATGALDSTAILPGSITDPSRASTGNAKGDSAGGFVPGTNPSENGGFIPGSGSTAPGSTSGAAGTGADGASGFIPGTSSTNRDAVGASAPGTGPAFTGAVPAPGTGDGFIPRPGNPGESAADGAAYGGRAGSSSEAGWQPAGPAKARGPHTTSDGDDGSFENPYASSWDTNENGRPQGPANPGSKDGGGTAPGAEAPRGMEYSDFEPTGSGRSRKETPVMEHGAINLRKKRPQPTYKQDPENYPDRDSIMVKGTQAALDESVVVADVDTLAEVRAATNVACITISSPRFSGYLVAALGADRQIDDEFMKTVQDRLFSFLRANGENLADDEGMNLKLEKVEFEEWAISQADFLRKSVHGADEIAMAFFPSKDTETKLEQSVAENMLKMGIDELRDDIPVEFDLYIYLPSNKKYLLYTPQGRRLYGDQRGRLRDKGVTHMHLRKDDAGQVKRYRAQIYLNQMIGEFKRKERKTA